MQKLIVKNFGPIKDINLDVADFLVFVGPQATGKSTISKLIYFFKSAKNVWLSEVQAVINQEFTVEQILKAVEKRLNERFVSLFGEKEHLLTEYTFIQFVYNETLSYQISSGLFNVQINETFYEQLNDVWYYYHHHYSDPSVGYVVAMEGFASFLDKTATLHLLFPAGRIILSLLADQLQNLNMDFLDGATKEFVRFILNNKHKFEKGLASAFKNTQKETILSKDLATSIIKKILKGNYQYQRNNERFYLENDIDVSILMNYISSGQQESLWVLYWAFYYILYKENVAFFVEEPEAHLFPEAQKDTVDLLSLLFNTSAHNQIIITTHSPYILASINNLLYANKIGRDAPEATEKIVPKELWIDRKRLGAYFVDGGGIRSIIDEDLEIIRLEEIDVISQTINRQFDDLFDIEFKK